jgi:hypothetical protein
MNLSFSLFYHLFPQTFAETFAVDNFFPEKGSAKIVTD